MHQIQQLQNICHLHMYERCRKQTPTANTTRTEPAEEENAGYEALDLHPYTTINTAANNIPLGSDGYEEPVANPHRNVTETSSIYPSHHQPRANRSHDPEYEDTENDLNASPSHTPSYAEPYQFSSPHRKEPNPHRNATGYENDIDQG